jgi:hypothetical protein
MRKLLISLSLLALPAMADSIYTFSLLAPDGNLTGSAGSTVGWGYSIHNASDSQWLVTAALNAGSFQFASPQLIFDFPVIAPGATVSLPFNAATEQGLYALTWDRDAPSAFRNFGNFVLSAEWWSGDPDSGGQYAGAAPNFSQPYSATVTPEPPILFLWAGGFGLLALSRQYRHTRVDL